MWGGLIAWFRGVGDEEDEAGYRFRVCKRAMCKLQELYGTVQCSSFHQSPHHPGGISPGISTHSTIPIQNRANATDAGPKPFSNSGLLRRRMSGGDGEVLN